MGKTIKMRKDKIHRKIKKLKGKIKQPVFEPLFNLQYTDLESATNE